MRASRRRPALFYDADCGFCRRWIARWSRSTGDRVRYLPYQRPGRLLALPCLDGVPPGVPSSSSSPTVDAPRGAAAVFRMLLRSHSPWVRLAARGGLIRGRPPRRRGCLPVRRGSPACVQPRRARSWDACSALRSRAAASGSCCRVRALPLRGLGLVYVVAFTSLKRQVLGLYGARGILPIQGHLQDVDRALRSHVEDGT